MRVVLCARLDTPREVTPSGHTDTRNPGVKVISDEVQEA